jgi:excisionase family DNA binding protein
MTETQKQLTSVEEASRRLAVSTFTTRRLIKANQLRTVRVGRRVLIPEGELDRIIREGCGPRASARRTKQIAHKSAAKMS